MPLIKRKKTIRNALRDVLLAPFVVIGVSLCVHRWLLITTFCVTLVVMWMAREPLSGLVPGTRTIFTWVGVCLVLMLAAVPLAIRDYFADGGYEVVWVPDKRCLESAAGHIQHLIAGDLSAFYCCLSETTRLKVSMEAFEARIRSITKRMGFPAGVSNLIEVEMFSEARPVDDNSATADCAVSVLLTHANQGRSEMQLYLNSNESFQIVDFEFYA